MHGRAMAHVKRPAHASCGGSAVPGVEGGESLSSLQQNRVAGWQRRELENGPGETQIETGSCGFAGAHAARIARPRILLRGTENHAAVTAEDSQQTGRRAEQARRRHGCKAKQVLPLCLGFPESLGNFRQSHKYKKRTHHHQVSKSPQLQKPLVLVLPAIPHRQLAPYWPTHGRTDGRADAHRAVRPRRPASLAVNVLEHGHLAQRRGLDQRRAPRVVAHGLARPAELWRKRWRRRRWWCACVVVCGEGRGEEGGSGHLTTRQP